MFEANNKLVLKTHDDWQWEDSSQILHVQTLQNSIDH